MLSPLFGRTAGAFPGFYGTGKARPYGFAPQTHAAAPDSPPLEPPPSFSALACSASAVTLFVGHALACRRGDRLIFRRLGFALDAGGALILGGPNGSGKSSLLRLMAGLLPVFAGTLSWAGEAIAQDHAAHRARLHLIGHQDAVKPLLTVSETVSFWAGLRGASENAAQAAIERFGLGPLADAPCRLLSAGQKKRLSLARLLASQAPLWLLDEPTTGLDAASTRNLEAILDEHRESGGIVIATTHIPLALAGAQNLSLADFTPSRSEAAALMGDL
jgi:heme exporter protein A